MIFITGGSGFIGSALCAELRGVFPEEELAGLARSERGAEVLASLGVRPVMGDLTRPETYEKELRSARIVYHLAANAAFGSKADYRPINVDATRALAVRLASSTVLERLVFTSSIGAVDRAPGDACARPLDADSPAFPVSEYGRSKLAGEIIVRESGLPFTIVRPSWVYGPAMRRESHIAVLLKAVAGGSPLARLDLPGKVSVIYAGDLARALARIPGSPLTLGKTYFADDGDPPSFGRIFSLANSFRLRPRRLRKVPAAAVRLLKMTRRWQPFKLRCLHSDVLVCAGKLFEDLGLEPAVRLPEGLRRTWDGVIGVGEEARWIVTGAASGIGKAIARELEARGKRLVLVDRAFPSKAGEEEVPGDRIEVDLAREGAVREIAERLRDRPVEGIVNCAGFGKRAAIGDHSHAEISDMVQVNLTVPMQLVRTFLPGMRDRRKGYILDIASSIAPVPLPGMGVYAATKAALLSFGKSLWGEVEGDGIKVTTALPSGTRTSFQASAGVKVLHDGKGLLAPERVAAISLRALEGGRPVVRIGLGSTVLLSLSRMLPARLEIRFWRTLFGALR